MKSNNYCKIVNFQIYKTLLFSVVEIHFVCILRPAYCNWL